MKCDVYCTSAAHFAAVNAIDARYFLEEPPARIFVGVPEWFAPFDIEIDCVAMMQARSNSAQALTVDHDAVDLDGLREFDQELGIAVEVVNLGRLAFGESRHRGEVWPIGDGREPTLVFAILAE
jgi:hypothetical protein